MKDYEKKIQFHAIFILYYKNRYLERFKKLHETAFRI